jgi:hypothetical protein
MDIVGVSITYGTASRIGSFRAIKISPAQTLSILEQGEGKPEDGAGHLGSLADSDYARPLHRRRPRRDDRGSGKVSGRRGIRNGGIIHKRVTKNPVEGLETSTKSNYRNVQ